MKAEFCVLICSSQQHLLYHFLCLAPLITSSLILKYSVTVEIHVSLQEVLPFWKADDQSEHASTALT